MELAVVIPTYKRIAKLERCIKSIMKGSFRGARIYVMVDNNDAETFHYVNAKWPNIITNISVKQQFVIGAWNKFAGSLTKVFPDIIEWDAMAWIVDDVELYPDCLDNAVRHFKESFQNTDGVVGIAQECPGHPEYTYKQYGQALIGRMFVERYPNNELCCPDYYHLYQDEELHEYAQSLGKFSFCPEAKLKHYHPGFIKEEMDETHHAARGRHKPIDIATYNERKRRGLVWGKSFELIHNRNLPK